LAYSGEVRRDVRLEKIRTAVEGAQLLHVKTTIEIYDRHPDTQDARLVESREDLDLLIDPATGDRRMRTDAKDPLAWDALADGAKLIHIPITCHPKQLGIILDDDTKVVGVISGSRAGKTHSIAYRLLRRWMQRGERGASFWWLSPMWKQTEIGIKKLIIGDGAPPVFPPELVRSYPKDQYQVKQYIELVDGSRVDLFQCGGKGDNLKGFAPKDIFVDELAAIRHRENWTVSINRLTTHRGTIAAASTPVGGHWSRADIVVRAQHSDAVVHHSISIFDNPWEHPDTIEELIDALGGHDDPIVRREFYGEWVVSERHLWPHWNPEDHLVQDHEIRTIADLVKAGRLPKGYVDVTARAASGYWDGSRDAEYILGQDFNVNPMGTSVLKIFGLPDDRTTWGVFIVDEVSSKGSIQNHCEVLKRAYGGRYAGAPVAVDSTGARVGTHPSQGATGSSTNRTEMRRAGFLAKACHRYRGKPMAPRQIDSLNLIYRLQIAKHRFLVHARCVKTCEGFDCQERAPDGRIAKEPNTHSDRISSLTDAARYGIWPLFMRELKNKQGNYAPRQD
jgi:hypothetical protein